MVGDYKEVQSIPPHPDYPNVENVIVDLVPYSYGTMFAQLATPTLILMLIEDNEETTYGKHASAACRSPWTMS